jgi:nucleotide-binding universal stress UspA family protein
MLDAEVPVRKAEPSMPGEQESSLARVVAGVDGSPLSEEALRWATSQAALIHQDVDAITAWQLPGGFADLVTPADVNDADYRIPAEKALLDSVRRVVDARSDLTMRPQGPEVVDAGTGVTVRLRVVEGHPARVLVDASDGASLLVVGSRGRGGFAGLILGSVSLYCVSHAHCPVVVLRAGARP